MLIKDDVKNWWIEVYIFQHFLHLLDLKLVYSTKQIYTRRQDEEGHLVVESQPTVIFL